MKERPRPRAPRDGSPARVWPATVVGLAARRSPVDERASWVCDLAVRVRTTRGRPQLRRLRHALPPDVGGGSGALVAAFRAVLGRAPMAGEEPDPSDWVGRPCGVVLDGTWDADGRQSLRVAGLLPVGAVTERPDAAIRGGVDPHAWVAVYRLAPETDGDVVELIRTWLARALRLRPGYRGIAVVRTGGSGVVVMTVWDGAKAATAAAAQLRTWLEERQDGVVAGAEHHVGPLAVATRR